MNTNYKFTTRQQKLFPTQPYHPSYVPQNYVPYPPCQPCYGYPVAAEQRPVPYNLYPQMYQPQQPMAINKRFITNENEEFIIDPLDTDVNAFSYELTDKHICSIDFNDISVETKTSRYRYYGVLTATAYINKDGSIDFVLRGNSDDDYDADDFYGNNKESIDLSGCYALYKRTFTTEEIKSVGDHCMEKLLVAFMNEALAASKNK